MGKPRLIDVYVKRYVVNYDLYYEKGVWVYHDTFDDCKTLREAKTKAMGFGFEAVDVKAKFRCEIFEGGN